MDFHLLTAAIPIVFLTDLHLQVVTIFLVPLGWIFYNIFDAVLLGHQVYTILCIHIRQYASNFEAHFAHCLSLARISMTALFTTLTTHPCISTNLCTVILIQNYLYTPRYYYDHRAAVKTLYKIYRFKIYR